MNKATKIRYYIESLCIYDLKKDELLSALYDLLSSLDSETVLVKQSVFFNLLSEHKSFKHYISKLILTDDNVFTKAAAAGLADELGDNIIDGVKNDLKKLEEIASITSYDIFSAVKNRELQEILETMPKWNADGRAMAPLTSDWSDRIDVLKDFHKTNGYGKYAKYAAFVWRDHDFVPITAIDPIKLTDLKNYEKQRTQVLDNTLAFLDNLPANNVLLYGDRGTGKSSTIHAILNEYKTKGLRMIEISKGDINELTMIREKIAGSPMKFIIFIDDLSFDSHDDSFGELKAALEGSLSGRQSNTIIYATSNRRHLIKENFSDRENDVNRSDTLQEELSLSDRFGLSITFMNPDKKDYQDIAEKIAADRGLEVDMDKFLEAAEQFARRRGGRSPRCAKQFTDYVEGCIKRGIDW
ncbi:MAG: ATP-binding protein [Eubacterium sp.]